MPVEKIVAEAVRHGIPALALTDINNTMGIMDFVRACREQ
jgi:DNA polymerase III alpha subunit